MSALSALHGASTTIFSNLFIKLPIPQPTPDLPNQIMIVTGANSGLGLETSRHLLRLGLGKLVMAVRSPEKGEVAKRDLLASTKRDETSVEVWSLDMDSYDSVRRFAQRAERELPRLDGLLANAGIMTREFRRSDGGHEATVNVNVISTFLLGLLLMPKMRVTARETGGLVRFTVPNSALHYMAPVGELEEAVKKAAEGGIFAQLDVAPPAAAGKEGGEKGGELSMARYNLSKLLVLYGVRELAACGKAKHGSEGKGRVIVNTPNPSYCVSNLERETQGQVGAKVFQKVLARTTEEGSRTLYHGLVIAGEESDGAYLTNCHVQCPARHVTSEWGQQMQKRFFDELLETLEGIEPGISAKI